MPGLLGGFLKILTAFGAKTSSPNTISMVKPPITRKLLLEPGKISIKNGLTVPMVLAGGLTKEARLNS